MAISARMRMIAWACAASLGLAGAVRAEPFSELVIFSGSLSDTGNFASVEGPFPPPFFNGRSTNGPSVSDFLADRLQLSSAPSLHLIGMNAGTNYAVLGSLSGGNGPRDLPAQLDAYFRTHGNKADPKALFFVFIGGNDVIDAASTPDPADARRIIKASVDGIEVAVTRLLRSGAQKIMIGNFIDLGIAPAARDAGLAEVFTAQTLEFNEQLRKAVVRLELRFRRHLMTFDFFRFGEDYLAQADKLGFTNTTDSCLALLPSGGCDFEKFVFFNEVFPTSRIQDLLGNRIAADLVDQLQRPLCTPFGKLHCKPFLKH